MHKFRATYLGAFILGWLLAVGVAPAAAYYSPLPATATFTSNSVSRTVYDPKLQKTWGFTSWFGGDNVSVVDLKQHNGVIAWIMKQGTTYQVTCSVYDPGAGTFKEDTQGPFTDISQFQIVDGVVAYVAGMPPSLSEPTGYPAFKYATYGPAKGAWQHGEPYVGWVIGRSSMNLATKDGVVLLRYVETISGVTFNVISWDIYDPKLGKWWPEYAGHSLFSTTDPITSAYINNATIYYTETATDFMGWPVTLDWVTGYNPNYDFPFSNPWQHKPTKPLAYFVAQPKLGSSPLWVWFTDMSIAGADWSWVFGDNFYGIGRSPYHIFTSPGNFQVTQWISGPSTYSQTITVKRNSLPGMLHLLLLAD